MESAPVFHFRTCCIVFSHSLFVFSRSFYENKLTAVKISYRSALRSHGKIHISSIFLGEEFYKPTSKQPNSFYNNEFTTHDSFGAVSQISNKQPNLCNKNFKM